MSTFVHLTSNSANKTPPSASPKTLFLPKTELLVVSKNTDMANIPTFTQHIRDLIAKDDFKTAIQQLSALLKDSPRLDEAVQQSARYNNVMQQIRLGLVDFEAANITQNQIRHGVLELLREMEEQEQTQPSIKAEVEKQGDNKTIIQNAEKIYNINHIDNANFS